MRFIAVWLSFLQPASCSRPSSTVCSINSIWRAGGANEQRRGFDQIPAGYLSLLDLSPKSRPLSANMLPQRGRSSLEFIMTEQRKVVTATPENSETPLEDVCSWVTPTRLFFVRNHFAIPTTDLDSWRLRVEGCVERP